MLRPLPPRARRGNRRTGRHDCVVSRERCSTSSSIETRGTGDTLEAALAWRPARSGIDGHGRVMQRRDGGSKASVAIAQAAIRPFGLLVTCSTGNWRPPCPPALRGSGSPNPSDQTGTSPSQRRVSGHSHHRVMSAARRWDAKPTQRRNSVRSPLALLQLPAMDSRDYRRQLQDAMDMLPLARGPCDCTEGRRCSARWIAASVKFRLVSSSCCVTQPASAPYLICL